MNRGILSIYSLLGYKVKTPRIEDAKNHSIVKLTNILSRLSSVTALIQQLGISQPLKLVSLLFPIDKLLQQWKDGVDGSLTYEWYWDPAVASISAHPLRHGNSRVHAIPHAHSCHDTER